MTKSRNRKLIRVTSLNERLKHCVDLVTDIWTKFGTELKYHTVNTPEWSNSHNLKIYTWRWPPSWFLENVSNSELDRAICTKFTAMRRWLMTKSWNRKSIRVTSSNECRKHRCDELKAYKSSQLTDVYFKPMQNSPVRDIV